jgi:hypothetical protein
MATRNQVVTAGQGQAIDLHIPAVKIVMDLYGVRDQRAVLDRVRWLWHEIEHQRGE